MVTFTIIFLIQYLTNFELNIVKDSSLVKHR